MPRPWRAAAAITQLLYASAIKPNYAIHWRPLDARIQDAVVDERDFGQPGRGYRAAAAGRRGCAWLYSLLGFIAWLPATNMRALTVAWLIGVLFIYWLLEGVPPVPPAAAKQKLGIFWCWAERPGYSGLKL